MKKVYIGLAICLVLASVGMAEDKTSLAYWSSTTFIDSSGNVIAPNFYGKIAATNLPNTLVTNITVTLTRQVEFSVTNATATATVTPATLAVGTNVSQQATSLWVDTGVGGWKQVMSASGGTVAVAAITNVTQQTATLNYAATNAPVVVVTVQTEAVKALTNVVLTIQRVP